MKDRTKKGIEYLDFIPYKCISCKRKITIKYGRCKKCANKHKKDKTEPQYAKDKITIHRNKTSLKKVIRMIQEDIYYQTKKLTGSYENDKAINWRIIGMESLRDKIQI